MKRLSFLLLPLFLSAGTYSGIEFTEVEENTTLYLVNYGSFIDINDILRDSTVTNNILDERFSLRPDGFTSISQLDNVSGVNRKKLWNLKQSSHIFDTRQYVNDLGLTFPQYHFLMALSGLLLGFLFLFSVVLHITLQRSR